MYSRFSKRSRDTVGCTYDIMTHMTSKWIHMFYGIIDCRCSVFFPKLFPIASKSNIKNTLQWSPHNHPWSLESQNLCGKWFRCFGDRRYFPTWQSKGMHAKSTKSLGKSTKVTKFHGFPSPSILEEFLVHHLFMFLLLEMRRVKIDVFFVTQIPTVSLTVDYKSVMVLKHQGEIPQNSHAGDTR